MTSTWVSVVWTPLVGVYTAEGITSTRAPTVLLCESVLQPLRFLAETFAVISKLYGKLNVEPVSSDIGTKQ